MASRFLTFWCLGKFKAFGFGRGAATLAVSGSLSESTAKTVFNSVGQSPASGCEAPIQEMALPLLDSLSNAMAPDYQTSLVRWLHSDIKGSRRLQRVWGMICSTVVMAWLMGYNRPVDSCCPHFNHPGQTSHPGRGSDIGQEAVRALSCHGILHLLLQDTLARKVAGRGPGNARIPLLGCTTA